MKWTTLSLLCAMGVASVAKGSSWFDAGVAGYGNWPADGADKDVIGAGTWKNTSAVSLLGDEGARRLQVGATAEHPLEFVPESVRSAADTASVRSVMQFSCGPLPDAADPKMKGAITAVSNEATGACAYYALAKDPSGSANIWMPMTGAIPDSSKSVEVVFTVRIADGTSQIRYTVDGVALAGPGGSEWLPIVFPNDNADVVAFGCYGSGELSALTGSSETSPAPVALTIPAIPNLVIESVTAGGASVECAEGAYAVPRGDMVTVTFAPSDGYLLAPNDRVMRFRLSEDGTLPADGRPVPVAAADVLSINEIMASNGSSFVTESGREGLDWVELKNTADFDVDVTGWYLHDSPKDKVSKWKKIEGRCIIPANGYAVVWADKDFTGFTANEAYTRIGLSTSGEILFLATPEGTVLQTIDFGKQIKDVSFGLGRVERVVLASHAQAEYRIGGSGTWKPVSGAIGMSGVRNGFTCVTYFSNTTVNNAEEAERFAANSSYWTRPPVTNTCETLAFTGNNGGTVTDFAYVGFPAGSSDNMIMIVTGSVAVPRAGLWTFATGSDDGFTGVLSRLGKSWAWEYPTTRSHAETYSTFNLPEAGTYDVRMLYFDKSGGKTFDVSVREGEHKFSDGEFKLLGSAASGIVHAGALGANVAADVKDEMKGVSTTAEWRANFTLAGEPAAADSYRLRIRYADGFTAKVNGTVIASVPANAVRSPSDALTPAYFDIPVGVLVQGNNTLEVTGVNNAIGDADFFLSPEIVWSRAEKEFVYTRTSTPGAANVEEGLEAPTPEVQFSVAHGWKTGPFSLELSCAENPNASIYYTLDGTSPTIDSPRYESPIEITGTTVVRAAVPNATSVLQCDASATYLFIDDVLSQGATPPPNFPANGAVNNQKFAYEMNPQIVSDYREKILRGFTNSIDTVSIVIDPENLFDSSKGIYVNATGNGRAWERATMMELISPTNAAGGFSVPAGVRIRGAYSRGSSYPKHSLRFFFRSEYGMSSLDYPLFGNEGTDKFDKIDLRAAQNNSWANNDSYAKQFTFIEECFSRDSQRDMNEPYNRSRYYNLFINGVYWGVYQSEERVCGDYGETYFGGVAEDYDVVRTSNPGYVTGVVEGTDDAWHDFWDITVNQGYGPDHADNYNRVLGLNPDGTRNEAYPVYLNPRNVMVHMLTAHYADDRDAPAAADKANNMAALYNRMGTGTLKGWIFNRHDAEHSMGHHGSSVSHDCTHYGTPEKNANFLTEANFNPAELNYRLMANDEYRVAFGDLVYRECLRPGGAYTVEKARARFMARMAELDDAVACESARWGWGKHKYEDWTNACNTSLKFIDRRLDYLIQHYKKRGWYPSVEPSMVTTGAGVALADGTRVAADEKVYLSDAAGGTVYYTTDGTDPRMAGGAVNAGATAYAGGGLDVPQEGVTFTMRRRAANGEWSALETVSLTAEKPEKLSDPKDAVRVAAVLSVTPEESGDGDEWIALVNVTTNKVKLSGLRITCAKVDKKGKIDTPKCDFTFAVGEFIEPNDMIVVRRADYWPDGKITNGMVQMYLYAGDGSVIQSLYFDSSWWGGACDGTGAYFVAKHFGAELKKNGAGGDWTYLPQPRATVLKLR